MTVFVPARDVLIPVVCFTLIRLVATVIAWGAKFSEHPLCIADRHQNHGQSAFAKVLIHRARDLAEDMKVHRVPNADHVVISLLLEPLQSRECLPRAMYVTKVLCSQRVARDGQQKVWRITQVRVV